MSPDSGPRRGGEPARPRNMFEDRDGHGSWQPTEPTGGYWLPPTFKIRSITSAPVVMTGRSSCRYTSSVVAVRLCPARRAISSMGTPSAEQGHEGVPQVPRCPTRPEPGRLGDLAELAPHIRRIQRRADGRGEDQAVILPQGSRRQSVLGLPLAVLPQSLDGSLGQRQRPPRLGRLGVTTCRTECHTATDGGTGLAAPGSPSRST